MRWLVLLRRVGEGEGGLGGFEMGVMIDGEGKGVGWLVGVLKEI